MRASALRRLKDQHGVDAVLFADNLWGLAALLWLITGLWRAFGGLEKGSDFYLHDAAFLVKMGLFTLVFALEVRPMLTLIRWRIQKTKGIPVDISVAGSLSRISLS
jgi:putative membrane protein